MMTKKVSTVYNAEDVARLERKALVELFPYGQVMYYGMRDNMLVFRMRVSRFPKTLHEYWFGPKTIKFDNDGKIIFESAEETREITRKDSTFNYRNYELEEVGL